MLVKCQKNWDNWLSWVGYKAIYINHSTISKGHKKHYRNKWPYQLGQLQYKRVNTLSEGKKYNTRQIQGKNNINVMPFLIKTIKRIIQACVAFRTYR